MEPKKLLIMQMLTEHLSAEIGVPGCMFDMRPQPRKDDPSVDERRVYRGRTIFGEDDPVPAISILEAPVDPRASTEVASTGTNREQVISEWTLFVQGWVPDDEENPTDPAYRLAAAIEHRLGLLFAKSRFGNPLDPKTYLLGGRVAEIKIGASTVRPVDDLSVHAYCYLPVVLTLAGDVSQPFEAAE